jgi:hypothetical protein
MGVARAAYRIGQFLGSLRPRVSAGERAELAPLLSAAEQRLFDSMTLRDQRHGLDVCQTLTRQGQHDPALLAAALLHDVGKGRISLWQRVAYVLLRAAAPALLARLAADEGAAWRQALWRCLHHPERGAEMAAAAGSAPEVVRLIRLQESDDSGDSRLRLLRAADEAC